MRAIERSLAGLRFFFWIWRLVAAWIGRNIRGDLASQALQFIVQSTAAHAPLRIPRT